jgi:hypothetical protein
MLVNPKQAEAVELAAATGRPRLVLRGSGDDTDANTMGITVAELRGRSSRRQDPWTLPAELFTPRPTGPTTAPTTVSPVMDITPSPQRTIKVIRAGSESEVTIDLPRGTYDKQTGKWMTDAKQ